MLNPAILACPDRIHVAWYVVLLRASKSRRQGIGGLHRVKYEGLNALGIAEFLEYLLPIGPKVVPFGGS